MKLSDSSPEAGVAPDFSAPIHEGASSAEKLIIGGPVNLSGEKDKPTGSEVVGGILPETRKLIDSYSDFVRQTHTANTASGTIAWTFKPQQAAPPVAGNPISPFRMPPDLSNKAIAPIGVTGPVESHWTDDKHNSHWVMSDGRAYRQYGNGSVFFDGDYGSPEAALDFLKNKKQPAKNTELSKITS